MHKKKAKILVIGRFLVKLGDAAAGKSTLVQAYAKKNYQFSSDYSMVSLHSFRHKEFKFIPKSFLSRKKTPMLNFSFSIPVDTNSTKVSPWEWQKIPI